MSPAKGLYAELRVGEIVASKWRIERKLGAGGCGVVYTVVDKDNAKQRAALKVHLMSTCRSTCSSSGPISRRTTTTKCSRWKCTC